MATSSQEPSATIQLDSARFKVSYNRTEAAQATGVSFNCIAEAVSTGQLPSFKKGRERIILKDDLLEWITQQ